MYVPFLTDPDTNETRLYKLFRRKGGGGGGKGSTSSSSSSSRGGSSKSSSSSSKSSSSSGSSSSSSKSSSGSSSSGGQAGKSSSSSSSSFWGSKSKSSSIKSSYPKYQKTTTYGNPLVPVAAVIPAGQIFAGRIAGGATRAQIYGTRTYGSGYPGVAGRGTAGRGFPFIFWPIAWPVAVGGGAASAFYLHNNLEYGDPTNSSRPGGSLSYATIPLSSTTTPPATFQILSDNSTIASLLTDIHANCTGYFPTSPATSITPAGSSGTPFVSPYTPPAPQPEQTIQYYRASSILLSLSTYNNSQATYASTDGSVPDAPLPTLADADMKLLECLNTTIGLAAPLINGASGFGFGFGVGRMGGMHAHAQYAQMVGMVYLLWWLMAFV